MAFIAVSLLLCVAVAATPDLSADFNVLSQLATQVTLVRTPDQPSSCPAWSKDDIQLFDEVSQVSTSLLANQGLVVSNFAKLYPTALPNPSYYATAIP